MRSFSDYQVGDRVDARSETGVSGLQKCVFGCYSSIQLQCDHCWRAMENLFKISQHSLASGLFCDPTNVRHVHASRRQIIR